MAVKPPKGFSILSALARTGSQKRVFQAVWTLAQRQVALKQLLAFPGANEIVQRELRSHPLSVVHDNIIQTHFLQNEEKEVFLVEDFITALNDGTRLKLEEAASLLRDITSAIAYLSSHKLIHGDVKPDNIGRSGGRYLLLDFGVCRDWSAFEGETSATGTIRTRPPELLKKDAEKKPGAVDIWALGASIFNLCAGRFPLFESGEPVPRKTSPQARSAFIRKLCARAENEYQTRVDVSLVPVQMRGVLARMLDPDPARRIGADELLSEVRSSLAAYLHPSVAEGAANTRRLSPAAEIEQMSRFVTAEAVRLMPPRKIEQLKEHLKGLVDIAEYRDRANAIYAIVEAAK